MREKVEPMCLKVENFCVKAGGGPLRRLQTLISNGPHGIFEPRFVAQIVLNRDLLLHAVATITAGRAAARVHDALHCSRHEAGRKGRDILRGWLQFRQAISIDKPAAFHLANQTSAFSGSLVKAR